MKYLIASDIHGSAYWCRELINAFDREMADRLVLLGDILYHGPRNDLPQEYAPKEVAQMLNKISHKIFCVRGNCDAEVDRMMLDFPILAEYAVISLGDRVVYATHGHKYGVGQLPLSEGDILICGHTHIPVCEDRSGVTVINDGSVSIPKENSPHSYMTLDGDKFLWKNLETGESYLEYRL